MSMSTIGTNVAQSLAGAGQAERSQVQEKRNEDVRRAEKRTKKSDEVVVRIEAVEAARRLAGNDQEEAREDRHSHTPYTPGGQTHEERNSSFDVEG